MTNKQARVYNALVEYIKTKGYVPSIRELASLLGYKAPSNVHRLLKSLEDKGYIKRVSARAIDIMERDKV
ncbi:helix-turn-helix domain-containing protein [Paenibacillus sp. IITD108]|uniref:LexA family protein n=1 Tax=Paenibacillus sp. IITD108 TaxID=3116649 RepID=UPI002F410B08